MDEVASIATQYNGVYATPTNQADDANPDLFTQVLRYDNPVAAIGSTTPQYNGNIAQIQWQVAGREAQAYTYTYDKLDRLTNAEYTDIHEGSWWSNAYDKNNRYQESLSYDDRGNIMTLNRRGQTQKGFVATNTALMGGNHGTIDNLTYTYNDKNQVTKIIDAATLTEGFKSKNNANTGQYSYDANGNMTSDINKEITNIEYNYLNLPVVITFTNSRKIEFTYDATGKKWRKVVTNGSSISVRDYIDGAEYESVNNAASEPKIIHHMAHPAQGGTEGYIEYDATQLNTTWKGWVYHYTLKDHLGNTRVTFSDANDDGYVSVATDVKQVNSYYPFGLNMEGNWNGADGKFKFGYNGKELNDDFGLGWNDYGARFYDAAIGRWLSIEPLAEQFYSYSPYNYVLNNPIVYVDPDGKLPVPVITGLIGAAGGLIYGLAAGKSWEETAALTAGGFVAGATFSFISGGVIAAFGGEAAIGASGLLQTRLYSGIAAGIFAEVTEQGVEKGLKTLSGNPTAKNLDEFGIVLSGVFGVLEVFAGQGVDAASDALKSETKKVTRAEIRRAEKEVAKQIQEQGAGQISKSEAKTAAKKLVAEAQKQKAATLQGQIKIKKGAVEVSVSAVTTTASEEGQDKIKNSRKN